MTLDRLALLVAAVVPALAVLGYGIVKARSDWRNEALSTAFLCGALFSLLALFVELGLLALFHRLHWAPVPTAAVHALFGAALPEESVKLFVLLAIAVRHVDARRLSDTVTLAVGTAVGFAALENLIYLAAPAHWTEMALLRAATAVPSHGIDGLAMGALAASADLPGRRRTLRLALALAVPVTLHAAYDFPLLVLKSGHGTAPWAVVLWLGVNVASAVFVIRLCNRVLAATLAVDRRRGRDAPAPSARLLAIGGASFVIVGPLLMGAGLLLAKPGTPIWIGGIFAVLPLALGIDLIATARHPAAVMTVAGAAPEASPYPR